MRDRTTELEVLIHLFQTIELATVIIWFLLAVFLIFISFVVFLQSVVTFKNMEANC